jgi:NitT/TauT family transport system substrate-binding protein
MKKRIVLLTLALTAILSLTSCGGNSGNAAPAEKPAASAGSETPKPADEAPKSAEAEKEVPETSVIRWNYGTSGNVLVTIAEEKGYFEEEGLTIEFVSATANADAMALLATGKTDVVSNSGTSNPLQQIASGVDLTVFGGHMVDGSMPVVAKKGTKWNGVEDLIGKKFACNPSYFAFTGAVMDLGYEDPLSAVEWVVYTNYNDALAAVVRGEVDYALQGTGQNYAVKNMDEVDIVAYQGDVMPNYSCCRLVTQTSFIEENPITVKHLMKALIRAQQYYEANKEEAITLQAENIGTSEEYVAAYMLNDNYIVNPDPLKNPVIRAWDILDKTGFLSEKAKNIDIRDHINTELYKAALDEVIAEHGDEDPEFYKDLLAFYEENNS